MRAEFLLDTNTVSYIIRDSSPLLTAHFSGTPLGAMVVSSVTAGEMLYGVAKKPQAAKLASMVRSVLASIAVLPWTEDTAAQYARLRVFAEESGVTISLGDLMIASHALEHELVLVTADKTLHRLSPHIAVQNWMK